MCALQNAYTTRNIIWFSVSKKAQKFTPNPEVILLSRVIPLLWNIRRWAVQIDKRKSGQIKKSHKENVSLGDLITTRQHLGAVDAVSWLSRRCISSCRRFLFSLKICTCFPWFAQIWSITASQPIWCSATRVFMHVQGQCDADTSRRSLSFLAYNNEFLPLLRHSASNWGMRFWLRNFRLLWPH